MTRAELVQAIATQLGDVPVTASRDAAVLPPAVVVSSAAPYRNPTATLCWGTTWTLLVVGGRADDVTIDDTLDALADRICALELANVVNEGALNAPAIQTIGDVDYLVATFTLVDYHAGG